MGEFGTCIPLRDCRFITGIHGGLVNGAGRGLGSILLIITSAILITIIGMVRGDLILNFHCAMRVTFRICLRRLLFIVVIIDASKLSILVRRLGLDQWVLFGVEERLFADDFFRLCPWLYSLWYFWP